jgi:hypothetical protein
MKLVCLHLDDAVVIPRSKLTGGGSPLTDTRDSSFHIDDGWDIRETLPGIFVITNGLMAESVTIGGYGYSFCRATETLAEDALSAPEPKRKGRR